MITSRYNYNSNQSFSGVYVTSDEAVKLLRKADKAVKASDAIFVDVNIPEGHRRPLWSVLSEYIAKRQQNNNNNIIIDIVEKGKQLLSVKTLDAKGFVHKKWTVNPMPVIGKYNEIFPSDAVILGNKTYDKTLYGRSAFFDVIDNAEAEADMLMAKDLANSGDVKTRLRELPRTKRTNRTKGKAKHIILKKAEAKKLKEANIKHVQRPFLMLKDMLFSLEFSPMPKAAKAEPKNKIRVPRQIKKEMKKSQSV